jgi:hypothetical protein
MVAGLGADGGGFGRRRGHLAVAAGADARGARERGERGGRGAVERQQLVFVRSEPARRAATPAQRRAPLPPAPPRRCAGRGAGRGELLERAARLAAAHPRRLDVLLDESACTRLRFRAACAAGWAQGRARAGGGGGTGVTPRSVSRADETAGSSSVRHSSDSTWMSEILALLERTRAGQGRPAPRLSPCCSARPRPRLRCDPARRWAPAPHLGVHAREAHAERVGDPCGRRRGEEVHRQRGRSNARRSAGAGSSGTGACLHCRRRRRRGPC